MSNVQWGKFKVGDIFSYERGKESSPKRVKDGNIPMVAEINSNNGVAKMGYSDNVIKGNSITVSVNFAENVYYQPEDFIASVNVIVIRNPNLNEWNGRFIETIISQNNKKYDYQNKISKTKLRDEVIHLPEDEEGNPDWEYMENFIRDKQEQVSIRLDQLTSINETPKTLVYSELEGGGRRLEWKDFTIKELFNVIPTKHYGKLKDREIEDEDGDVRFITTTSFNNGVKSYSKLEPNNEGNVITYSDTTNEDSIFYQDEPFIGRSHVQKLIPRFGMDEYIAMYIITSIKSSVKGVYDYSNKFNRKAMNGTVIPLPVTSEGEPHWEFISRFMETQQGIMEKRLGLLLKEEDAGKEHVFTE